METSEGTLERPTGSRTGLPPLEDVLSTAHLSWHEPRPDGRRMPGRTTHTWLSVQGTEVLVHVHLPEDHETAGVRGVVVVVSPNGQERLVTHRLGMLVAADLVTRGYAVARPEPSGVSHSGEPAPGDARPAPQRWTDEVEAVAAMMTELAPGAPLHLVATRSASLVTAPLAARLDPPPATLTLVVPSGTGRAYLRGAATFLVVSETNEGLPAPRAEDNDGVAPVASVDLTAHDAGAYRAISLAELDLDPATSLLVVDAGDQMLDKASRTLVERHGDAARRVTLDTLAAMLDRESQFSVVRPDLVGLVVDHVVAHPHEPVPCAAPPVRERAVVMRVPGRDGAVVDVVEEIVDLDGRFGVLTLPVGEARRAFVWAPGASEPADGSGGLNAASARHLALEGVAGLRFDLSGYGEESHVDEPRDAYPYHDQGVAEHVAALRYVRRRFGVVPDTGGLCAGAWMVLRAAAQEPCREVVLVNNQAWSLRPEVLVPEVYAKAVVTSQVLAAEDERVPRHRSLLRRLLRERTPYLARLALGRLGRIQAVEPPLAEAAARGAHLRLLLCGSDLHLMDRLHADRAVERLRARGVVVDVVVDPLLDHGLLSPYARRRVRDFVRECLDEGPAESARVDDEAALAVLAGPAGPAHAARA